MSGSVAKYYRYFVSDSAGRYIAEWTDVTNDFDHVDEVNTFGGSLTVDLGRSLRNQTTELGYLLTEAGEILLTEDSEGMVAEFTQTVNVGANTDIDHNHQLAVYEYYGDTGNLLTEDGDTLTTEDDFGLLWQSGALDGRRVFYGYISKYEVREVPVNSGIRVTALPMATDFGDIIFENYYWTYTQSVLGSLGYTELTEQNGTDVYGIVQTFQAPATGTLLRIVTAYRLPADVHLFGILTITVKLYTGSDPNAARTLLYTGDLTTDYSPWAGMTVAFELNVNDGPALSSGSDYHIEISVGADRIGGAAPVEVVTNSGYVGGSYWSVTGVTTTYVQDAAKDVYFILDVLTSRETQATYSSWDLAAFVDQTVDLVPARGGRTAANNPITDYIEDPLTTVPEMVFNVDTYKDRLDTAVKAAPIGWYYRYDHTNNSIWFKPRHETADHTFIAGVHLQSVEVEHDAENIVNVVYFTGGETTPGDSTTKLYRRYVDSDSVATYGIKAKGISDLRITDPSSADIRGEYEVLANKDPVYRTEVVVLDPTYDTGTILAGQTVGFTGFGTFVDDLVIQVMRKHTVKGKVVLTLGALPPTERKRLNDLKVAVDQMTVQNNDPSPS